MWKLLEGQTLNCRGWNDEFLVYNDVSGDTHLLGVDAMELLRRLQAGPAAEEVLAQALAVAPDEREGLALTLEQLAGLSLIERL
jgi:PqqD family protein of HPr-rel-A system